MRQQVHPDIRITGIITDGPTTIASIPERAAAMFRVRGFDEAMVLEVVEQVKDCAVVQRSRPDASKLVMSLLNRRCAEAD